MNEKLMGYSAFNNTEKIFIAFLEVLTIKGTTSTDKSNAFFGEKMGISTTYVSTMIKKLVQLTMITTEKKYARRHISINNKLLEKYEFITKKSKRGLSKND